MSCFHLFLLLAFSKSNIDNIIHKLQLKYNCFTATPNISHLSTELPIMSDLPEPPKTAADAITATKALLNQLDQPTQDGLARYEKLLELVHYIAGKQVDKTAAVLKEVEKTLEDMCLLEDDNTALKNKTGTFFWWVYDKHKSMAATVSCDATRASYLTDKATFLSVACRILKLRLDIWKETISLPIEDNS